MPEERTRVPSRRGVRRSYPFGAGILAVVVAGAVTRVAHVHGGASVAVFAGGLILVNVAYRSVWRHLRRHQAGLLPPSRDRSV
jgi:hypothetical protein